LRFGLKANVLVDDATLPRLAGLLLELEELGARDVSLLSYVGGDEALQLTSSGRRRLAAMLAAGEASCRGDERGLAALAREHAAAHERAVVDDQRLRQVRARARAP
jgi:hypothetical protein